MSLKKYLILMSCITLFCWLAWLVVLFYLDPEEAGFLGLFFFYASFLLALVGTFSLIGFFVRVWFSKEEIIFRHLGISFRQAVWFAILLVGVLMLLGVSYLKWWNVLLLILFLTIVEFLFLSKRKPHYA